MRRTASQPAPSRKAYNGLKVVVAAPDIKACITAAFSGSRGDLQRHNQKALRSAEEFKWRPIDEKGCQEEMEKTKKIMKVNSASSSSSSSSSCATSAASSNSYKNNNNKKVIVDYPLYTPEEMISMRKNLDNVFPPQSQRLRRDRLYSILHIPTNNTSSSSSSSSSSNSSLQIAQSITASFSPPPPINNSLGGMPPRSNSAANLASPQFAPARKKYFSTGKFNQKILSLLNKVSDDEEKFSGILAELVQLPWNSIALKNEENAEEMKIVCSHFLEKACAETNFVKHYARLAECISTAVELNSTPIKEAEGEKEEGEKNNNNQKEYLPVGQQFRSELLARCKNGFETYFDQQVRRLDEELNRQEEKRQRRIMTNQQEEEEEEEEEEKDEQEEDEERERKQKEAKKRLTGIVRFASQLYLCGFLTSGTIDTIIHMLLKPLEVYHSERQRGEYIPHVRPPGFGGGKGESGDDNNNNNNNNNSLNDELNDGHHLSEAQCDALHVILESCAGTFAQSLQGASYGVSDALHWAIYESTSHPKPRARFLMMNVKDILAPYAGHMFFELQQHQQNQGPNHLDNNNNNNFQQQQQQQQQFHQHQHQHQFHHNHHQQNNNNNNIPISVGFHHHAHHHAHFHHHPHHQHQQQFFTHSTVSPPHPLAFSLQHQHQHQQHQFFHHHHHHHQNQNYSPRTQQQQQQSFNQSQQNDQQRNNYHNHQQQEQEQEQQQQQQQNQSEESRLFPEVSNNINNTNSTINNKIPYSKERLVSVMNHVVESGGDASVALASLESQQDPVHFLDQWFRRVLSVSRCKVDRQLFPEVLSVAFEEGIISLRDVSQIVCSNIHHAVEERLWEDIPHLFDNWAEVIARGTNRIVSVTPEEENQLRFDGDDDPVNWYSSIDDEDDQNQNNKKRRNNKNKSNDENQEKEERQENVITSSSSSSVSPSSSQKRSYLQVSAPRNSSASFSPSPTVPRVYETSFSSSSSSSSRSSPSSTSSTLLLLHENSTVLLHPAWHNHMLSRILAATLLFSYSPSPSTRSAEGDNDDEDGKVDDQEEKQRKQKEEAVEECKTVARNFVEAVYRIGSEEKMPESLWNIPVFLWRTFCPSSSSSASSSPSSNESNSNETSPEQQNQQQSKSKGKQQQQQKQQLLQEINSSSSSSSSSPPAPPSRVVAPRFRFLAVLSKFFSSSTDELSSFLRSLIKASALLQNSCFEAQLFLSLVDGQRPNINTLAKHRHVTSHMMPMLVVGAVTAASMSLGNEKYRAVPDWLLATIDGRRRAVREALSLYEIAASGFWIDSHLNYLSWGFRFVSFLKEGRVISDDVVDTVRSSFVPPLSSSSSSAVSSSSASSGNSCFVQIDAMLGPNVSHVRRIQANAVRSIRQNLQ